MMVIVRSFGLYVLVFALLATFSLQLAIIPIIVTGMLLVGHNKPH